MPDLAERHLLFPGAKVQYVAPVTREVQGNHMLLGSVCLPTTIPGKRGRPKQVSWGVQ